MTVGAAELGEALAAAGVLTAEWQEAFAAAPRHRFVPEVIWVEGEQGWRPLSRDADPDGWWRAVNSDGYVVTQVDDGRPAEPGAVGEYSTSSASQPSLVLRMLNELRVEPGMRVVEIGTGTGYNAALLAARLGPANVITIEVDAELADRARRALEAAGFGGVRVVTGDGADGYRPGAPYDRVIATASTRRIPREWIAQTRPGGLILTPFGNAYHNDALVRLTVQDDGSAVGRFRGRAAFMWMRQDRVVLGGLGDYVRPTDQPDKTVTDLDPQAMFGHPDVDFAIGVRCPDVSWHRFDAGDGSGEFTIWLINAGDHQGRSWASVDYEGHTVHNVDQHGPRRLWDEVETAYLRWVDLGQPNITRHGLTITPDGTHQIWVDGPDGHRVPITEALADRLGESLTPASDPVAQ